MQRFFARLKPTHVHCLSRSLSRVPFNFGLVKNICIQSRSPDPALFSTDPTRITMLEVSLTFQYLLSHLSLPTNTPTSPWGAPPGASLFSSCNEARSDGEFIQLELQVINRKTGDILNLSWFWVSWICRVLSKKVIHTVYLFPQSSTTLLLMRRGREALHRATAASIPF